MRLTDPKIRIREVKIRPDGCPLKGDCRLVALATFHVIGSSRVQAPEDVCHVAGKR